VGGDEDGDLELVEHAPAAADLPTSSISNMQQLVTFKFHLVSTNPA
jgi:hypothetical protein